MSVSEIAKRIAKAKASGGGNYFSDGRGRCVIKELSCTKKYKGLTFIAEMEVLSSESFQDAVKKANPPGSQVSFVQLFDEYPDTAFPNTKAFLLELTGDAEDDVTDDEFGEAFDRACSKDQPFRGMVIDYSTYRKDSKAKVSLCIPKFKHVPQTVEEIAAQRAKLDASEKK